MDTTIYPTIARRSDDPGDRDEETGADTRTPSVINKPEAKEKSSRDSVSTATFRDFLLKPELLRALIDCGFEQPSEGNQQRHARGV